MAASCNSVTVASPQNSPANSTKERFRRLRARTQAANSIAMKEDELFVWSSLLSRCTGVPGTRRRRTSFKHFITNTEVAGAQVHTSKGLQGMTLRLDTDAGKHRALKGGTKLDN